MIVLDTVTTSAPSATIKQLAFQIRLWR